MLKLKYHVIHLFCFKLHHSCQLYNLFHPLGALKKTALLTPHSGVTAPKKTALLTPHSGAAALGNRHFGTSTSIHREMHLDPFMSLSEMKHSSLYLQLKEISFKSIIQISHNDQISKLDLHLSQL